MSLSTRVRSFIAVAGGLAGIATLLFSLMAALPSRYGVLRDGVHCEPGVFSIERLSTSSGVRIVDDCSEREDVSWTLGLLGGSSTLSASGEVLDESSLHIWIVLVDCYDRAYLQYPPARLSGSRWSMNNIRVGREIASIEFWGLDEAEHRSIQRLADGMIKDRRWPAQTLEDLPAHHLLGSVDLLYKAGFLSSIF